MYIRKPHPNWHKKYTTEQNLHKKYVKNIWWQPHVSLVWNRSKTMYIRQMWQCPQQFSYFIFSKEGHIGQRFFLGITALVSLLLPLLSLLYTRDNIALKKQFKRTWNVRSSYSELYDLQKTILIRIAFLRKRGSTCEILYIWTFAMWTLATSFKYVKQFFLLLTVLESLI